MGTIGQTKKHIAIRSWIKNWENNRVFFLSVRMERFLRFSYGTSERQ